jgi:hypothetical protein
VAFLPDFWSSDHRRITVVAIGHLPLVFSPIEIRKQFFIRLNA